VAVHSTLHLRCLLVDRTLLSFLLFWTGALLLVPGPAAFAQADWSVRHFSTADGLAQNFVTAALQDADGYMWFGTRGGLSRFDGTSFLTFRSDAEKAGSISSNLVEWLFEDRAGRLWVTTPAGVDMLDAARTTFVSADPGFRPMIEDAEGALWGRSKGGGIHRARFQGGRFVPLPLEVDDQQVQTVARGPNDTVWALFGMPGDLPVVVRYDGGRIIGRDTLAASPGAVLDMVIESPARIWISATSGIFLWSRPDNTVSRLADGRSWVRSAGENALWVLSGDRLGRITPGTGNISWNRTDPRGFGMPSGLATDRSGGIWVLSMTDGLMRVQPRGTSIRNVFREGSWGSGLASDIIMPILEDRGGDVWIGTLGGGLHRMAGDKWNVEPFDMRSACGTQIWSLHEDRGGTLWVGTDEGLCFVDRRAKQLRLLKPSRNPSTAIEAIAEDSHGRLWLAMHAAGLGVFDRQTREITTLESDAAPFGRVSTVFVDQRGALWFGMTGPALGRLDVMTGSVERITLGSSAVSQPFQVWSIIEAGPFIWVGTDQGLFRVEPGTLSVRHFGEREGIDAPIVFSLLHDLSGALWLGTSHGLARFDMSNLTTRFFRSRTGLRNVEFNRRSAHLLGDGVMAFGGTRGITLVRRAETAQEVAFALAITHVELADRAGSLRSLLTEQGVIRLPHDRSSLRIHFSVLDFDSPDDHAFEYRLDPLEDQWIDGSDLRAAIYRKLPPGRYVFRVRGAGSNGLWNDNLPPVTVIIPPPFWATWWFRAAMVLVFLSLALAVHRARVRVLLREERLRYDIAQDLHDDVGAGLGSIIVMSDMIRRNATLDERQLRRIASIRDTATELSGVLREIVWAVRPGGDTLSALVRHLSDLARIQLDGLEVHFRDPDAMPDPPLTVSFRHDLMLIYKEVLHNIARHAGATLVTIDVVVAGDHLIIEVVDNGNGYRPGNGTGNGMQNMRSRAERISGRFDIRSTEGGGTSCRIEVRLPKHHAIA
jgi:signal transduction histidine kinase